MTKLLFKIVRTRNVTQVKEILKLKSLDMNRVDEWGNTLLNVAT